MRTDIQQLLLCMRRFKSQILDPRFLLINVMFIAKVYKKRIVNINFNITLASLIATLLAAYPVMLFASHGSMTFMLLSAFMIDAILDGAIFTILHKIANNHKNHKQFILDTGKIQFQRVILSIIFFVVAITLDYSLMHYLQFQRASSFLMSYTLALIVTRSMHTIYGLKTGLFK